VIAHEAPRVAAAAEAAPAGWGGLPGSPAG
jgi:hypothetical protein